VRRCRLLDELGPLLDYASRDRERLAALLALDDAELIDALAGRRREQLHAWHAGEEAATLDSPPGGMALCVHEEGYPAALRQRELPRLLTVLGGGERFAELLARPLVAILDCEQPSGYGAAVAAGLARGLTAAGVTVVAGLVGCLAQAAHDGAAEVGGSLAVAGCGLAGRARGARLARSHAPQRGCAVSELPWRCAGRRWGPVAAERLVVGLAAAVVVVESSAGEDRIWAAEHARARGVPVGAVPGMVTNGLAGAPHALLASGAQLVTGPSQVLEMLYRSGDANRLRAAARPRPPLQAMATRVLELIGSGVDTQERLAAELGLPATTDAWVLVAALGELETLGLICRREHGRYVHRELPP
jgi:DNA processing protein